MKHYTSMTNLISGSGLGLLNASLSTLTGQGAAGDVSVVKAYLGDHQGIILEAIYHAMFICYSARPET